MGKALTIIIPIYNVERYIRPCLLSVLNQGLATDAYEVILINDGTKDNSLDMISDLVDNCNNIKVIEQSNKGLSAARNIGIARASGEYILFVDSDDYLIENSLKKLLDIAIATKADLIVADYIVQSEEMTSNANIYQTTASAYSIKSGSELFLDDLKLRDYFVWRTIYKRQFIYDNNISFIEGITFEDSPFTIRCYLNATKCVKISYPFYVYRRRHGTLSSFITMKSALDLNKVIEDLWTIAQTQGLSSQEKKRLSEHIYVIFSLNLWYISKHKDILSERKYLVNDLKDRVPRLYFHYGIKQRLVSILFNIMPCSYLKIKSLI